MGIAATFATERQCKQAVTQHCPDANGVTYSSGLGECWCNRGMTGYIAEPTLRTCWFEGGASHTRLWSWTDVSLQNNPDSLVLGCALVGAAVVGAAAGFFAFRRLQPRHQALVQDHAE